MKGKRWYYVCGIILSALTSSFVVINPRISQIIVDQIIVGTKTAAGVVDHHLSMLIPLLLMMIVVQVTISSMRYLMVVLFEKSSQYMLVKIRTKLFENLQRQDMQFYDDYRTGDLMTRLTGDLDLIRHFCAWITYNVVDSVFMFTVTMVYSPPRR